MIARSDVDIIDIAVPQYLHHDIAIAAAKAGKYIFCEKPLAMNAAEAQEMLDAARVAGVVHYVNHNYRRTPAVMLAKRLIDEGKIGRIFHWRGAYLQSWITNPVFPLTWHLRKETAGSGPNGDLNSHSIDLARFLVGDIQSLTAMTTKFIAERPLPGEGAATFSAGSGSNTKMGKVTVEDAAFLVVRFNNGALGSFEATRFATGRRNYNTFEIYGDQGSLLFNLERMNELQFFSASDPDYAQGFRDIMVTESSHAYISHWWPPGHIIGYEHEFTHTVIDFMHAIATAFDIHPTYLIRDNDSKFGPQFAHIAAGSSIKILRTPYRAPKANAICERFLGSVRRECLDHFLVLSEQHLLSTLKEYVKYFNQVRPHQSIGQRIPIPLPIERVSKSHTAQVRSISILGGLHHNYKLAA